MSVIELHTMRGRPRAFGPTVPARTDVPGGATGPTVQASASLDARPDNPLCRATRTRLNFVERAISSRITRYPVAEMHRAGKIISVLPIGKGFPISVSEVDGGSLALHFGEWFEDGLSAHAIIKMIEHALSGRVRLREEFLNGKLWRLSVDVNGASGDWCEIGAIGFCRFSIFRRNITSRIRSYPPSSMGT